MKNCSFFLDSGAYSFLQNTQSKVQNIDQYFFNYINFIKQYKNNIDLYANLDVISRSDFTKSAELSFLNWKIMKKEGLDPIPVLHYGENGKWLQKYLDAGCSYIALGGFANCITKNKYVIWADKIWKNILTDEKNMPIVKVHGFGITSVPIIFRYPWYSVDSTSWRMTADYGAVYIPKYKNGKWIYDETAWVICVSNKNIRKRQMGEHIFSFSQQKKQHIFNYISDKNIKFGKSEFKNVNNKDYKLQGNEKWFDKDRQKVEVILESGICNDYIIRGQLNIQYFIDLQNSMKQWPQPLNLIKKNSFDFKSEEGDIW